MSTAVQYRYRVPYVPAGSSVPATGLLPFIQLHAPNAERAARLGQAVTGAAAVLEPERLGEVVRVSA